MRGIGIVDVAVAGVFDNVAFIVGSRSCPVATVIANCFAGRWVSVDIKSKNFISPYRRPGQGHADTCWVSLGSLQSPVRSLGILLGKDSQTIQLVINRIGKQVTACHKV
jgi:hypothetical protein